MNGVGGLVELALVGRGAEIGSYLLGRLRGPRLHDGDLTRQCSPGRKSTWRHPGPSGRCGGPSRASKLSTVPLKQQRFIDVVIPLEDFLIEEPNLDLQSLGMLDWEFITDGSAPFDIRFGLDDLHLE